MAIADLYKVSCYRSLLFLLCKRGPSCRMKENVHLWSAAVKGD
ncbi:hypothetical protein HMPREF1250_2261 [Megasphaera vaginalis (ex Srinivasan et al. 2021)]|uniref:Uncharacterized protein n=1 Tax=Megasphaera vaginalis (ex Srinivasan et al. 2021) TaxID=1111454 RepID=U7UQR0_9FIRM|nr:hypothetical protein HMPREF1250_2261 [Megasphaera vaginalis (ex Srinivasan et al. 2021)]